MGKVDAFRDVALEAGHTGFKQRLLLGGDVAENINGVLSAIGLFKRVSCICDPGEYLDNEWTLTPSSMGTEKKSQPVFWAISAPPGTPGRYT